MNAEQFEKAVAEKIAAGLSRDIAVQAVKNQIANDERVAAEAELAEAKAQAARKAEINLAARVEKLERDNQQLRSELGALKKTSKEEAPKA